jgi:hypothetical protein
VSGAKLSPLPQPSKGWKLALPDEATKNRVIEGFRKWQTEHWNKPAEPMLFDELEEEE